MITTLLAVIELLLQATETEDVIRKAFLVKCARETLQEAQEKLFKKEEEDLSQEVTWRDLTGEED